MKKATGKPIWFQRLEQLLLCMITQRSYIVSPQNERKLQIQQETENPYQFFFIFNIAEKLMVVKMRGRDADAKDLGSYQFYRCSRTKNCVKVSGSKGYKDCN